MNPLTPIENVLTHLLEWLHGSVGLPWAWAVVALTIIVRMLLVPTSKESVTVPTRPASASSRSARADRSSNSASSRT